MNYLLLIAIFLILFELFKLMLELYEIKTSKNLIAIEPSNVTFILSAYNEESLIYATLKSIYPYNVIVGNDGSKDNTMSEILKYCDENPQHNVQWVDKPNSGKVDTINSLMNKVNTKYVVVADADIVLPKSFQIEMVDGCTAMAFNVLPLNDKRLVERLQYHEYNKSMNIGRMSKSKYQSVHCISGAIGLYETSRLIELTKQHKGNYPGEDLSRTLIELNNEGKVGFSNKIVYTDVPDNAKSLYYQRLNYWNTGLHFNLLYMFKMLFNKNHIRLKIELFYEIISALTDPVKVIMFFIMLYTGPLYLLVFYLYYVILESVVQYNIRSKIKWYDLFIFPLYNLILLFTRMLSLPKSYRLITSLCVLLVFSNTSNAQTTVGAKVEYINYDKFNYGLYLGHKMYYAEFETFPQTVKVGLYINDGYVDLIYRDNFLRTSGHVQIDKYKYYPFQYFVDYSAAYIFNKKGVYSLGATFQYIHDAGWIKLKSGYEYGYMNSQYVTLISKYRMLYTTINYQKGFDCAIMLKHKGIFIAYSYDYIFEYTGRNRQIMSIGYNYTF